jgi:endonuclease/exonuclease/phosphatase family metal-dependent hydrolase
VFFNSKELELVAV